MKRGTGLPFFVLALLAACGGGGKDPDAPLDREKFERVLAGSLLIEAQLSREIQVEGVPGTSAATGYRELFAREGVTDADFRATYDAWLKHPERLKEVYQDVLNRLQQQADSLGQRPPDQP